ncbi:alpha/beta hydrolase [Vibrio nigripulchritudo]|uniref:alpha/beta hydrolase n=1 Tax=Vibrio nigripulchritudo TaxID=28173 RepID=UPI0005F9AA48|nr:alpha/beta hydrolase [Vibrio nigripulchritudo]KJY78835.1 hypothetical protein TW74_12440 [Vibrio nigripulchritudo]
MLVITNRNIQKSHFVNGTGDHQAFGEGFNSKGPNEIRLAKAEKNGDTWQVNMLKEPSKLTHQNLPSKHALVELRQSMQASGKNGVLFVHGFNQSFESSLNKAHDIEALYGVEVIVFSWPSNPGGFVTKEYRTAKRNALASIGALDATLEKLGAYLKAPFDKNALKACHTKFSLMTYSLGNFLFQNYVNNALYEDETRIFDNVVLCQADVDNSDHACWVENIEAGKRVYVTINENDGVLKWSDANFQKDRLGRTARNLTAKNAAYFDFTDGPDVDNTHGVFHVYTNDVVKEFFQLVLNGERGEHTKGLTFDQRKNAYRF